MKSTTSLRPTVSNDFRVYFPYVFISIISIMLSLLIPISQNPAPVQNKPPTELFITARKMTSNGPTFVNRRINISESVIYVDMWRSHWCTYYNDREFFFTPRINELLQRLRLVGFPVVHISMGVDAYNGRTKQRRAGKEAVSKGNITVLENYNALTARYHHEYIPGFVDTCVYTDQERYGKYRDNHFTKVIAIAENDRFV
jgi:hypothetical protein